MLEEINKGRIELIIGGMYSGKSDELISRLERAQIAEQNVVMFKPTKDDRYGAKLVKSRSGRAFTCVEVAESIDILHYSSEDTQVIGIDEIQFFDDQLFKVCNDLANLGLRVIVSGLDTDFQGEVLPTVSPFMAADVITKKRAICMKCKDKQANFSQRVDKQGKAIVKGDKFKVDKGEISYQARCRDCFVEKSGHE